MKDLLKLWAKLEPTRCRPEPCDGYIDYVLTAESFTWNVDMMGPDSMDTVDLAMIQYATQQAIKAHGFGWMTSFDDENQSAIVWSNIGSTASAKYSCPSAALLWAYVKVLKILAKHEKATKQKQPPHPIGEAA